MPFENAPANIRAVVTSEIDKIPPLSKCTREHADIFAGEGTETAAPDVTCPLGWLDLDISRFDSVSCILPRLSNQAHFLLLALTKIRQNVGLPKPALPRVRNTVIEWFGGFGRSASYEIEITD